MFLLFPDLYCTSLKRSCCIALSRHSMLLFKSEDDIASNHPPLLGVYLNDIKDIEYCLVQKLHTALINRWEVAEDQDERGHHLQHKVSNNWK